MGPAWVSESRQEGAACWLGLDVAVAMAWEPGPLDGGDHVPLSPPSLLLLPQAPPLRTNNKEGGLTPAATCNSCSLAPSSENVTGSS